jgi:hypothetical protein
LTRHKEFKLQVLMLLVLLLLVLPRLLLLLLLLVPQPPGTQFCLSISGFAAAM